MNSNAKVQGEGEEVAPDGSPVAVYRALPIAPEFTPVLDYLIAPMTVLDLGCGVGRLANELAERGFHVTGVDESGAMLRHLDGRVQAVEADLRELALNQVFDVVVLASHLVNVADAALRRAFLQAASDHVARTGQVLIQHWESGGNEVADVDAVVGEVGIAFRVLERQGAGFRGRVRYTVGDDSWVQDFCATLLDDSELDTELMRVGLQRAERLSPKWVVAQRRR